MSVTIMAINAAAVRLQDELRTQAERDNLRRYIRRMLKKLGPDAVAEIVAQEFRRAAWPKHLRRYL